MATKQNMYVGLSKEAEEILKEIDECVVIYAMEEDGFLGILSHKIPSAESIRDEVAKMQGKLEIALKGLDKNSTKRENYSYVLRKCIDFLEKTK